MRRQYTSLPGSWAARRAMFRTAVTYMVKLRTTLALGVLALALYGCSSRPHAAGVWFRLQQTAHTERVVQLNLTTEGNSNISESITTYPRGKAVYAWSAITWRQLGRSIAIYDFRPGGRPLGRPLGQAVISSDGQKMTLVNVGLNPPIRNVILISRGGTL